MQRLHVMTWCNAFYRSESDQVNSAGIRLVIRSILEFFPYKILLNTLHHSCTPTKQTWSQLFSFCSSRKLKNAKKSTNIRTLDDLKKTLFLWYIDALVFNLSAKYYEENIYEKEKYLLREWTLIFLILGWFSEFQYIGQITWDFKFWI